jgi:hypothetical protein
MQTTSANFLIEEGFSVSYDSRFSTVYINPEKGIIFCQLNEEYTPIENFKETFNQISVQAKKDQYSKFIFDKRALRTFHQPSMEWYFITWKQEMLKLGISKHRKILPELEWFKKAVQIAKIDLEVKFPDNVFKQLDIQYCNSIEEAIVK